MDRVLYIGDPHIRPDSVEEGEKLVKYICKIAKEHDVDYVCFLGDLFHTHSVVHLSVLSFWQRAFKEISDAVQPRLDGDPGVYSLVGNHDMSGKADDADNALMLYDPDVVRVVIEPGDAPWGALLMPYVANHKAFVDCANVSRAGQKVLVCHQTFDGSMYENGFYAKDGIDPNLLEYDQIISGHIHTPQQIGKVWYPGSPRWQTVADANVQRAIWIVDHDENGAVSKQAFDTSGVCRAIYALEDREGAPVVMPVGNADVIVDVYGTQAYVKARAEELEALGARVRQFPDVERVLKVKESDGLPTSMRKFLADYTSKNGTDTARLLELAESRISWMRTAA